MDVRNVRFELVDLHGFVRFSGLTDQLSTFGDHVWPIMGRALIVSIRQIIIIE